MTSFRVDHKIKDLLDVWEAQGRVDGRLAEVHGFVDHEVVVGDVFRIGVTKEN